jgi:hypothetical protein
MPDVGLAPVSNGAASRFVDRRTLLVGAAGAQAAAGLSGQAGLEHEGRNADGQGDNRPPPRHPNGNHRRILTVQLRCGGTAAESRENLCVACRQSAWDLPLLLPWADLAVDLPAVEHRR